MITKPAVLHRTCLAFVVGLLIFAGRVANSEAQGTQTSIAPSISVSANGRINAQAFQGSPIILNVSLFHPNMFSRTTLIAPLLINAQNGSWANTLHLAITDNNGAAQNWPIQSITPPVDSLILDQANASTLTWVVAPSATSVIAPGSYTAIVSLDTTASAGTSGWRGVTTSHPVTIQIAISPSSPTVDVQEDQAILLATYDGLLGNTSQGVADLSSFLSQNPSSVRGLAVRGDLLEQSGQIDDALEAYDDSVAASFSTNPGTGLEPPAQLLEAQGRLASAVLSRNGQRGIPQVQIKVSNQGTQAAGVSFLDVQITNAGSDDAGNVSVNQFALQQLEGSGQAILNNVLSPRLPVLTDYLAVNASATVRIFVNTQGTVNNISLTETGTTADIFGTQAPFSQTQTISLNSSGGGGGTVGELIITGPSASQVYGQATPAINNVSYSGFVNGDGPGSLSGTLNCVTTAQQSSPVGSYPITCSGLSSSSYTITFLPGTLSITPAALTVTAQSAARQFGQGNPPFTASVGGFVNSDTASSLSGVLACTSIATASSSVSGSPYPITCAGVSSANYKFNFIPGSLTITKAVPVMVWSNPADITQGIALGSSQLNATASVPGVFTYVPAGGTVLSAGAAQTLAVTFAPTDSVDYNSASASVKINVNPKAVAIPGDLNGDGVANCDDLKIVKAAFGKKTGQAGFDTRADVNHDGVVNILDLSYVAKQLPAGMVCQ
jgi:MBG domain (YGX type)/Dockerin type I domain